MYVGILHNLYLFIPLSIQILVYQFGVQPSKSTHREEFLQRPRRRSAAGRPVPSCAGRGWAAATGPGTTATPVLP